MATSAVNQLGSIFSPVIDGTGHPVAGANVGVAQPVPISSAVALAGIASLTFAGNPGLQGFTVGGTLLVSGFSGADVGFNVGDFDQGTGVVGGATILAVTSTQVVYAAPNASGTASSSGTALQMGSAAVPPAGLVPLWSDPQLSEPQPNPLATDGLGNWNAFVSVAGFYYIQFYNQSIATTMRLALLGGGIAAAGPIINSISPSSGLAGTSVTITGNGFGATQFPPGPGASAVLFNGIPATITSWSPTAIVAVAPTGVSSGNVNVSVNGAISNGVFFTVIAGSPTISSLNPAAGPVGTVVTINGSNFDSTGTVTFNGITAPTSNWTSTAITVAVPSGATTGPVIVTVAGVASNPATFGVAGIVPNITGISPTSGPVGTVVTISGSNFGLTQGTSTVTFGINNTAATPTSWGVGSIIVPVPAGANTGPVVVTVGGVNSNGVVFTVTTVAPGPTITSLNPPQQGIGASITIVGTNFGTSASLGSVTFNGTPATVVPNTWTPTQIVVTVPTGATTGPVVVTQGGVASPGVTFTLQTITPLTGPTIALASITGGLTIPPPNTSYAGQPGMSLFLVSPWSPSVSLAVNSIVVVSGTSFYDGHYLVAGVSPGTNGPDNYGMTLVSNGNIQTTVIVGQGNLQLP